MSLVALNRSGRAGISLLRRTGFLFLPLVLVAQDDALAERAHHAKELMAAGRYEEAIPLYRQLVKAVPGNAGLVLNLGLAQEMAGHPEAAIPQFETVLKTQPESIPALTSLGTARLQVGQPGDAIAPLRKLTTLQPANRDARGMLAGALMATDHPEEAAANYRKLGASDPNDVKAWYGLGSAYEAAANRVFEQLTKLDVKSPYWAALVAESRLQRGQYRSAFFFYRHAEEAMPKLRGVHAGLAQVYRKTGHEDWAALEDKLESEVAMQPCAARTAECDFAGGKLLDAVQLPASGPSALFWKTKAYNALAIEAFSRLGPLPESAELHSVKAEILKSHAQFKEAAEEWRAALTLAPGDARLTHELTTTLFLGHDFKAAIPMLQEALRAEPASPDLNYMLGDSLLRTEHPEQAVPYLEAALRADGKMVPAHASLGFALSQMGKAAEAIPHLERALDGDDDGSLHYQLARAYQGAGDAAKTKEMMSQYQQINAKSQAAKEEVAKEAEITAPD